MKRHYYDQPIGWFLFFFPVVLGFGTLKTKHGWHVMFPKLVPYTGTLFVIIFMTALVGFCLWQKAWLNLGLVAFFFIAGFLMGYLAESNAGKPVLPPNAKQEQILNEFGDFRSNYDWTRHRLIFGLSVSSMVLGVKLLRENSTFE